jgi:sugar phosphate isomerase/epimerase
MKKQTADQIGVCSWSLLAKGAGDLAGKVKALGLKRVQLGLTPHREDPGAWDGALEVMNGAGIEIVSGMFSTIGEDYSTPDTIRRTGGVVLDEHWDENWELAKAAAGTAKSMGLKLVSTHAGFLPHDVKDPAFEKLAGRLGDLAGLFADHGAALLLETGQESGETLVVFLEEMRKRGAGNLGVNFDPCPSHQS